MGPPLVCMSGEQSTMSSVWAACLAACLGGLDGPTIAVGVAKVDITPDYPVRLHGYNSRQGPAVGVQQRLFAKALAIGTDAEGASVLISLDNLGVTNAIGTEIGVRLARVGMKREHLAITASHTHSAPCLKGVAPHIFGRDLPANEQAAIDRYTQELTDKLEKVALAALADRRAASLAWGQGRCEFAINRRVIRPDGTVAFGENGTGPVDHSVPVLIAKDDSDTPRAIVVGYACHCTTLDPKENVISGDWAGYAQEAIEKEFPSAIALTIIGCGADANPIGRTSLDKAKEHGASLAKEAARIVREGPLQPLRVAPDGRSRTIELPFDTLPTRDQLEKLKVAGGAPGHNASKMIERLDQSGALSPSLRYQVQTWRFGEDLVMVFLAGEVVVDYATRLKGELDARRIWVVAYANDAPCYVPSERVLREGGYEAAGAMVYYAHPTRLAPGVEDRIISAVRELVPTSFRVAP